MQDQSAIAHLIFVRRNHARYAGVEDVLQQLIDLLLDFAELIAQVLFLYFGCWKLIVPEVFEHRCRSADHTFASRYRLAAELIEPVRDKASNAVVGIDRHVADAVNALVNHPGNQTGEGGRPRRIKHGPAFDVRRIEDGVVPRAVLLDQHVSSTILCDAVRRPLPPYSADNPFPAPRFRPPRGLPA
jgi:hypothetical protein